MTRLEEIINYLSDFDDNDIDFLLYAYDKRNNKLVKYDNLDIYHDRPVKQLTSMSDIYAKIAYQLVTGQTSQDEYEDYQKWYYYKIVRQFNYINYAVKKRSQLDDSVRNYYNYFQQLKKHGLLKE